MKILKKLQLWWNGRAQKIKTDDVCNGYHLKEREDGLWIVHGVDGIYAIEKEQTAGEIIATLQHYRNLALKYQGLSKTIVVPDSRI